MRAGGAAAIAELGLLLLLAVIISLTGQQLGTVSPMMANKAVQGYQQLRGLVATKSSRVRFGC